MIDNRSPLMKRLAAIMPKKPEPPKDRVCIAQFQIDPIQKAADAFIVWLNGQLPQNRDETWAMLLVFGEILNGEMERMLNSQIQRTNDLLDKMPFSSPIVYKLEDFAVGKQLSIVKEANDGTEP